MSTTFSTLKVKIHSIKNATELTSELGGIKSDLNRILGSANDSLKAEYHNHVGREFFRKLYNYGMESEIPKMVAKGTTRTRIGTSYDAGFRPDIF